MYLKDTIYGKSPPKLRSDLITSFDFSQVVDRPKPKITEQDLAQFKSNRKYKPYAFIRFSNEALTMEQSLNSILDYCDRGVLIYSDNSSFVEADQSVAIAQAFVEKNPGFILCKYPLPIIPQYTNELYDYLQSHEYVLPYRYNQIDCLYNYALVELIELARKNGEYEQALLFKVDMDHIYCPDSLYYAQYYLEQNEDVYDCIHFEKINVMSYIHRYIFDRYTDQGVKTRFKFGKHEQVWLAGLDFMYDHFLGKLDFFEPFGLDFKIYDILSDDHGINLQNVEIDVVKSFDRFPKHTKFLSSFHFFQEKSLYYNKVYTNNCSLYQIWFFKGQMYAGLTTTDMKSKNTPLDRNLHNSYRHNHQLIPQAYALAQELDSQLALYNYIHQVGTNVVESNLIPKDTVHHSSVETGQCDVFTWPQTTNRELLNSSGVQMDTYYEMKQIDCTQYDYDLAIAKDFYSAKRCLEILNSLSYDNLIALLNEQELDLFKQGLYNRVFPLTRYFRGNLNINQIFSAENKHLNSLEYHINLYQTELAQLQKTSQQTNLSRQAELSREIKVLNLLIHKFTRDPFVIMQSQILQHNPIKLKEAQYAAAIRNESFYRKSCIMLNYMADEMVALANHDSIKT